MTENKPVSPFYLNIAIVTTTLVILIFWLQGIRCLFFLDQMSRDKWYSIAEISGFIIWTYSLFMLRKLLSRYKALKTVLLVMIVAILLFSIANIGTFFVNLNSIAPFVILIYFFIIGCYILTGILVLVNPDKKQPIFKLLRYFGLTAIIITGMNFTAFMILSFLSNFYHYNTTQPAGILSILSTITTIFLLRFFIQVRNIDPLSSVEQPQSDINWPPTSTI